MEEEEEEEISCAVRDSQQARTAHDRGAGMRVTKGTGASKATSLILAASIGLMPKTFWCWSMSSSRVVVIGGFAVSLCALTSTRTR